MHVRGGSQWKKTERRDNSIGPLRRAHPASGATWNVQVVRGKMSTRCLWHACRALMLGMFLMAIGAGMATVGYYANDLTIGEFRNSTSVRIKNEQRGLHLNNLSYLGPIIMGVGGFIVVASCVMTFEARDSAAKVVPARFKVNPGQRGRSGGQGSRRTTRQSSRWEQHLGLFKSSPGGEIPTDRNALTAALVHFSRTLGSPKYIAPAVVHSRRISKSGSVPNLIEMKGQISPLSSGSPGRRNSRNHRVSRHSGINRNSREKGYLHPGMLRFHRHAISVDETGAYKQCNDSAHGSQQSVTFDPTPEIINNIITNHKKRERAKRSDTARRHVLSRQKPFEKEEPNSPKTGNYSVSRRRSSTISDNSFSSRRMSRCRRASSASRTLSFDSRCTQAPSVSSTVEIDQLRSPDKITRQISPRKVNSMLSTPSVEKEFRSQLSICSEPTVAVRQLSCQSSLEPCVPEEESPELEDKGSKESFHTAQEVPALHELTHVTIESNNRPDSLILSIADSEKIDLKSQQKYLYRSQSTRSFKKPKPKPMKLLSNDLDEIYVISSSRVSEMDDFYDSIEVIHERRNKNFSKFCIENEINNSDEPSTMTTTSVTHNTRIPDQIIVDINTQT
ncbi:unnamed protein product [Diamesa serratosioi]